MNPKQEVIESHKDVSELETEINEKILQKYEEKITYCANTINTSNIVGVISCMIFLVLFTIKIFWSFSWFFLLIPSTLSIVSYNICLNTYLKLNDILEEIRQEDQEGSKVGSILSYFCMNSTTVCILVYTLLLAFQLEAVIETSWNMIAIPIYLALGIISFYWIFILPAFIHNQLYLEMSLISIYLICCIIFKFLLNFKLDKAFSNSFFNIGLCLLFALGFHFICNVISLFKFQRQQLSAKLASISLIICSIVALTLTCLKADGHLLGMSYWIPCFLLTLGFMIYMIDKILEITLEENSQDETIEPKEKPNKI
jgi:hypothetical protein